MSPALCRVVWAVTVVCAASCATGPRPDYMERPDAREGLSSTDRVADFLERIRAARATGGGCEEAWRTYEEQHRELFAQAGAAAQSADEAERAGLCGHLDEVLHYASGFDRHARDQLRAMTERFESAFGSLPRMRLVLAVAVPDRAVFFGDEDGRPVTVLLNARHPELSTSSRREAALARALFRAWHAQRVEDSPSLGAVAARVHREGALAFAVRQLASGSTEADVLGLTEAQLTAARRRERIIAQELLASIDSASEREVARFFDPASKDPLVPPLGGVLVAEKLYQRVASEVGAPTRALLLTPQDFLARARKHLTAMANARD